MLYVTLREYQETRYFKEWLGKILKVGLCKLHLVINEYGEIQKVTFTAGNVDDRVVVTNITKRLTGLIFVDISSNIFLIIYIRVEISYWY
ncbi:transposase [Hyalomma marginatum]|nr:transposase [Hyalomma marginatum]